jgi:hypothetical protein
VTVEGVNIRSKHMKPMKEGETGRIMKREARHAAHAFAHPRAAEPPHELSTSLPRPAQVSIHISNVAAVDGDDDDAE